MLTSREKSDIEVLHRLLGIQYLTYDEEEDYFFSKARKMQIPSFIVLDPKDFPSLPKQRYSVENLLKGF